MSSIGEVDFVLPVVPVVSLWVCWQYVGRVDEAKQEAGFLQLAEGQ